MNNQDSHSLKQKIRELNKMISVKNTEIEALKCLCKNVTDEYLKIRLLEEKEYMELLEGGNG